LLQQLQVLQFWTNFSGIEPFASNYYKAGLAKGNFMRKNKYLAKLLDEKGLDNEETWRTIMLNHGSVQHLEGLTDDEKAVFKTFREISPMEIISQAAQRQQYIDQAQSLNLQIPSTMPVKDVNYVMIGLEKRSKNIVLPKKFFGFQRIDGELCDLLGL
jgi:ribonucleoside-diphosphate reductase alpha chain